VGVAEAVRRVALAGPGLAAALGTAAAAAAQPAAARQAGACRGSSLSGSFTVVRGSAGAGQIVYRLRLKNASSSPCWVSGLPVVRLLDGKHRPLPTHASAAQPGRGTAAKIELAPGRSATADARFSPDVPGPGEPVRKRCEPVAHFLSVTANGGGTVVVPIRPPTAVCSHGALSLSLLRAAG
jgi:hypothetical protein